MKTFFFFITVFTLKVFANPTQGSSVATKPNQQNKSDFSIQKIDILGFNSETGQFDLLSKFSEQDNPKKVLLKLKIDSLKKGSESDSYLFKMSILGSGKGRENDAEGKIEDFNFASENNSFEYGQYLAFLVPFPCNKVVNFKITIFDQNKKNVYSKTFTSTELNCFAN